MPVREVYKAGAPETKELRVSALSSDTGQCQSMIWLRGRTLRMGAVKTGISSLSTGHATIKQ